MASIKVTVQDSNNITVTLGLPNQLTVTIDRGVVGPMGPPGAGITPQAIGFTASGGTVSKTLTVALDANVSGTNTGDQTGGTPAVVLGTANTPGTSTNFLRRDDTILTFDATAPSTQAFSDAAVVGVATVAARRDHKHAMMATPTTISGNAGTATKLETPRAINGTNFDGTAAITVTAAGSTLTGATLSTSITTASITALPTGLSIGSGTGTLAAGATTLSGTLALGANSITSTGSLGATGARLTKGWFTDLEVTNAIAGSVTGTSATVTSATQAAITSAANLATVGTITTGVWQGTVVAPAYGGTGVANNAAMTVTGLGNFAYTRTLTAATNVTFPTSGTLLGTAAAVTVAQGGTGATTLTANGILYGNGTAAVGITAVGTATHVLTSNGAGNAPTFQATASTVPTTITVANEATDTTCFPAFFTAATGDLGPKSNANLTFNSATNTLGVNGVNVGRGLGGVSSNTAVGSGALAANTSAIQNTAMGENALATTTTGGYNVAFGRNALRLNLDGGENCAFGYNALDVNSSGYQNVAVGAQALLANTSGIINTAVGWKALAANISGGSNVAVGFRSLIVCTASDNTATGTYALTNVTSGTNNSGFGAYAGTEAGVINITTESNRVALGNNSISNFYCKVALTTGSDERDKTDIHTSPHGLSFINGLRPVCYRFDERSAYWESIKDEDGKHLSWDKKPRDGSKASPIHRIGFIAQEVIALEKSLGNDHCLIGDDEQPDSLKLKESALIPVLVKALQELNAKFDAYVLAHS